MDSRHNRIPAGLAAVGACLLATALPAAAQEVPTLRVKPSPAPNEAEIAADTRARQERLLKRMQQADYLFRNICRNCGGAIEGPHAYDPFDPPSRLAAGRAPVRPPTPAETPTEDGAAD
jgi:hypothetical protein